MGSTVEGNAGGKGSPWKERIEECKRKYAGGGTWSGHTQKREGECETKRKVQGIEESAGGKESMGMWNETQEKQQSLAGKWEGEQKLIKDEGLLATRWS